MSSWTDQQGNWFGTNPLLHVRDGAFFGHADALKDIKHEGSKVIDPGKLPDGQVTIAEAIKRVPGYCPPAVWFPYVKMGQSPTGLHCDTTGGKFGPFANQMFVGRFVFSSVNRVFLEKVGGEYQGACFPFRQRPAMRRALRELPRRRLPRRGSIQPRLEQPRHPPPRPATPRLDRQNTARSPEDGTHQGGLPFHLHPTPRPRATLSEPKASSYTYTYQQKYGSPEMDTKDLKTSSKLSPDGLSLEVKFDPIRPGYVHEFELPDLKSKDGTPPLAPHGLLHGEQAQMTARRSPGRSLRNK